VAEIVVPLNDVTAVVVYSKKVYQHAIRQTTAAKLMSIGLNARAATNFVQYFDETAVGPGDSIKYDLIPNVVGPGVAGDNPIAGQESAWSALQDTIVINQLRQAELLKGIMSQQRVPYSMRDAARTTLANWWKTMFDIGLMNQLCGNTAQTNVNYCGMQATIAPDAAHWIRAGAVAAEANLGSSNIFSASLLPQLVAMCNTLPFPIRPVSIKGVEVKGVLFLHPLQVKALKTNYTVGEWGDIYKAVLTGGQITNNPIFTGAIGFKDGIVLHEEPWCSYGDNTQNLIYDPIQAANVAGPTSLGAAATGTTSVARAVFVGAQAAALAIGGQAGPGGQPLRVRWVEELLDANNQLRITAGMVFGIKKSRFASQDYSTIVVSTWAA